MNKPSRLALCPHLTALAQPSSGPWLVARVVHGCSAHLTRATLTLPLAMAHGEGMCQMSMHTFLGGMAFRCPVL